MTPEGLVKARVKAVLNRREGLHYDMPVPSGYGKRTIDFIGCYRGFYFGVETKAGKGEPTPLQDLTIGSIRAAGGAAFVVNDDPASLAKFVLWLDQVEHRRVHQQTASGNSRPV